MTDDNNEPEAQAFRMDKGPDPNQMADSYFPGEHEHAAKTVLDLSDPAAVAALSQFGELFPEVEDLQEPIDEFLEMFLKSRPSVKGASREEYAEILKSMYGGTPEENAAGQFASLLAGDLDED